MIIEIERGTCELGLEFFSAREAIASSVHVLIWCTETRTHKLWLFCVADIKNVEYSFSFFFRLSQKIYHISRGTMGTQMPREPLKNSVWIIWILYIFKAKRIKFMQEEWPSFKLWVLGLKSTGSNLFWYVATHPSLSLNVMVHVCLSKSLSLSLFLSIWCVLFYFDFYPPSG